MEIRPTWENHPLYAEGVIELVPTEWIWRYWGTDVSPVDFDALWKSIEEEGMYDPLIMRVGIKNKKFRLEAGNHRIQLLPSPVYRYLQSQNLHFRPLLPYEKRSARRRVLDGTQRH